MARSESRTKVSIWGDGDFVALTKDAQRAYWMLKSQPTITLCGVLALTPTRWEKTAADETVEELMTALEELAANNFIVLDFGTEELWVRTFIVHDGVARSPKTLAAAKLQVGMIASATIREGVNSMFNRVANGGDAPESAKPLENRVSAETEIPYSDNRDTPRERARAVSVSCLQSPSPSPVTPESANGDSAGITPKLSSLPAGRDRDGPFEEHFELIWHDYPRKMKKAAARRSYVATRRRGADPAELASAVKHFAEAMSHRAPANISHGSTFFGPDELWTDYVEGVPIGDSPLRPVAAAASGFVDPPVSW